MLHPLEAEIDPHGRQSWHRNVTVGFCRCFKWDSTPVHAKDISPEPTNPIIGKEVSISSISHILEMTYRLSLLLVLSLLFQTTVFNVRADIVSPTPDTASDTETDCIAHATDTFYTTHVHYIPIVGVGKEKRRLIGPW